MNRVLTIFGGSAGEVEEAPTIQSIWVQGVGAFQVQGGATAPILEEPVTPAQKASTVQPLPVFSGLSGVAESAPTKEALWVRQSGPFQIQGGEVVALSEEPAIAAPIVRLAEVVKLLAGVAGETAIAPAPYSLQISRRGVVQLQSKTLVSIGILDPLNTSITHGLTPQNLARFSPNGLF